MGQITTRKLAQFVHGLIMQWPTGQLVIRCVADGLCNMGGCVMNHTFP